CAAAGADGPAECAAPAKCSSTSAPAAPGHPACAPPLSALRASYAITHHDPTSKLGFFRSLLGHHDTLAEDTDERPLTAALAHERRVAGGGGHGRHPRRERAGDRDSAARRTRRCLREERQGCPALRPLLHLERAGARAEPEPALLV